MTFLEQKETIIGAMMKFCKVIPFVLVFSIIPDECVFAMGFRQASKQILEKFNVRGGDVFAKIDEIGANENNDEISDDVCNQIIEDFSKYKCALSVASVESLAHRCIYLLGLAYETINPIISIKIYEFLSSCSSLTENVEARLRYSEMIYFRYSHIPEVTVDDKEYAAYLLEDLIEQISNGKIILSADKIYRLSDILGAIYCGENKPDDAINIHLLTIKIIATSEKENLFILELAKKIDKIKKLKGEGVF